MVIDDDNDDDSDDSDGRLTSEKASRITFTDPMLLGRSYCCLSSPHMLFSPNEPGTLQEKLLINLLKDIYHNALCMSEASVRVQNTNLLRRNTTLKEPSLCKFTAHLHSHFIPDMTLSLLLFLSLSISLTHSLCRCVCVYVCSNSY